MIINRKRQEPNSRNFLDEEQGYKEAGILFRLNWPFTSEKKLKHATQRANLTKKTIFNLRKLVI